MKPVIENERGLLPCPFCGHAEPSFERMGTSGQSCIVICGNCGCRHESGDEYLQSGSSWNERAALTSAPGAGEAGAEPVAYLVDWADIGEGNSQSLFYDSNAKELALADGWRWMKHPSRNSGKPIPVQVFTMDGVLWYRPFDCDGTEFEYDERDGEWVDLPTPAPSEAVKGVSTAEKAAWEVASLRTGVAATMKRDGGLWQPCSGCHESNEGHPTGPHSTIFDCALGGGCSECGGLGAVWTCDADFQGMADALAAPSHPPATPAVAVQAEPVAADATNANAQMYERIAKARGVLHDYDHNPAEEDPDRHPKA